MSEPKPKPGIKIINTVHLHCGVTGGKLHLIAVQSGGEITEGVQIESADGAKRTAFGFPASLGVLAVIDPDGAKRQIQALQAQAAGDEDSEEAFNEMIDAASEPGAASTLREELALSWLKGELAMPMNPMPPKSDAAN